MITLYQIMQKIPMGQSLSASEIATMALGVGYTGSHVYHILDRAPSECLHCQQRSHNKARRYTKIAEMPPPVAERDETLTQINGVTMRKAPEWRKHAKRQTVEG